MVLPTTFSHLNHLQAEVLIIYFFSSRPIPIANNNNNNIVGNPVNNTDSGCEEDDPQGAEGYSTIALENLTGNESEDDYSDEVQPNTHNLGYFFYLIDFDASYEIYTKLLSDEM